MFKNSFQGGPSLEVFSPQGSSSALLNWKVTTKSAIQRHYEKEIKGYCYTFSKNGKIQLPREDKQTAYLLHPFLILQCFIPLGASMSIELGLTDLNNNKRRFIISSAIKEYKNTLLHVMLPLGNVKRGVWLNVCFDLVSLISDCFKGQTFRSLDTITVGGSFRLRKIFSMKSQPPDTTGDYDFAASLADVQSEAIPKHLQFPFGVEYLTQVLTMARLAGCEGREKQQEASPRDSKYSSMVSSANSSIAFGRRIEHPLPPLSKSIKATPRLQTRGPLKPSPLTSRATTASPATHVKTKTPIPPISRIPQPPPVRSPPTSYHPEQYQDSWISSTDQHLHQADFPVNDSSVVIRAAHHRSKSHSRASSVNSPTSPSIQDACHVITSITEQSTRIPDTKEEDFDEEDLTHLQSHIQQYMNNLDYQDVSMAPAAESHDPTDWTERVMEKGAIKSNVSTESFQSNISNSWQHDKMSFIKNLSQMSLPPPLADDMIEPTKKPERPATTPTQSPRKLRHRPPSSLRNSFTPTDSQPRKESEWGGIHGPSHASDTVVDECVSSLLHTLRSEQDNVDEAVQGEHCINKIESHVVQPHYPESLVATLQQPVMSVNGQQVKHRSHPMHSVLSVPVDPPLMAKHERGIPRAISVEGELESIQMQSPSSVVLNDIQPHRAIYHPAESSVTRIQTVSHSVTGRRTVSHVWPEQVEQVEIGSLLTAQVEQPSTLLNRSSSSKSLPLATIDEDKPLILSPILHNDSVRPRTCSPLSSCHSSDSRPWSVPLTQQQDTIQTILNRSLASLKQLKLESMQDMQHVNPLPSIADSQQTQEGVPLTENRSVETAKSASLIDKSNEWVVEVSEEEEGDDTLELLYDSETGLYYDPMTNKYYELNK